MTQKTCSYCQASPVCSLLTQTSHTSPQDVYAYSWNLYRMYEVWKATILLLSLISTNKKLQARVPLSVAFLRLLNHGQLLIFRHAFPFPPSHCFSLLLCLSHQGNSPSSSDHTHLGDAVENRPFVSVWRMLSLTCQRTYFTRWERTLGQIPPYCKQAAGSGLTLGMSLAYFGWQKVS